MNRVAHAGALIVAAVLAAGCSGGSDASSTTNPASPATSPTTAPPATTPVPTTTTTPTSTGAPTTAPTTTAPAATLPADTEQVKQDVIAVATASWQHFHDAARDPVPDKVARMSEVMSGPRLQRAVDILAQVVASGRVIREHPTTPAAVTFYEDSFTYDPVIGTASIEFCRIGSDLGIEPGGNPDGTDKIIVDEINAYRERADLIFVDGRWLDNDGVELQKYEGTSQCTPA